MTNTDGTTITYKYDVDGIRTSKTVNGVTTKYTTINGKITSQSDGINSLYFYYDSNDEPFSVDINGTNYIYVKNVQGDIIAITDVSGTIVVRYTYDAWGNATSITGSLASTIGQLNPMRYRGYYYDAETGYYYLQSRYYELAMGRFINSDDPSIIVLGNSFGTNMFAYCNNNPTNMVDPSGEMAIVIAGLAFSVTEIVVTTAILFFAAEYAFDSNFRNAINTLIVLIIKGAINGVGYLTNVISDVVRSANSSKKYNGNEVHHIVAESDRRASDSRKLIKKYGISVNSNWNLVTISKTLHKHLHTNAYHAAVYSVLNACQKTTSKKSEKKQRLKGGLILIASLLRATSAMT